VKAPSWAALLLVALAVAACGGGDEPSGRIVLSTNDAILLVPVGNGSIERLPRRGWEAALSPDGKQLAYWNGAGIHVAPLRGGGGHRLPGQPPQREFANAAPAWAPDGERLVFVNGDRLYTISRHGNNLRLILIAPGLWPSPQWSPDGEEIVFVRSSSQDTVNDTIEIVGVDGSRRRRVGRGDWPRFSPDGQWIAYSSAQGVYVVSAEGGKPRLVVRDGFSPIWSPDGRHLAFDRHTSCGHAVCSGRAFIVPVAGGRARPLGPTVTAAPGQITDAPGLIAWID
jgi:Tol biopolymer transport system component